MAQEIKIRKDKFDSLLVRMLNTPPLPKKEVQVRKRKKKAK
jgi:hypothetical protein